MRPILSLAICLSSTIALTYAPQAYADPVKPVLVIHGGCGVERAEINPGDEQPYRDALSNALKAGYAILNRGGNAIDAVEAAVKSMEDSKQFNAGAGSAFDHEGHNTLDAAIMDGATHEVGAVAGVTVVKNPISAALAVMRKSKHVLFIGEGANQFARDQKLEIVEPSYFHTKAQWDKLQRFLEKERAATGSGGSDGKKESSVDGGASNQNKELDADKEKPPDSQNLMRKIEGRLPIDHKYGTVGAVALDAHGNLAAGTSTGGLTGKRWGRVGDSPVIGAGTYADNESCAVSCTGDGEWFIRYNVASDVAARVKYKDDPIEKATYEVIHDVLKKRGEGGVIALDREGNFSMRYNTEGMFRGYTTDGEPHTFIFQEGDHRD